jgi:hypothetical protein
VSPDDEPVGRPTKLEWSLESREEKEATLWRNHRTTTASHILHELSEQSYDQRRGWSLVDIGVEAQADDPAQQGHSFRDGRRTQNWIDHQRLLA